VPGGRMKRLGQFLNTNRFLFGCLISKYKNGYKRELKYSFKNCIGFCYKLMTKLFAFEN
jgi:hypothetical protein